MDAPESLIDGLFTTYDRHSYEIVSSMIYVPHHIIIPGRRFCEIYYWYSSWIVHGLLISMNHTVKVIQFK